MSMTKEKGIKMRYLRDIVKQAKKSKKHKTHDEKEKAVKVNQAINMIEKAYKENHIPYSEYHKLIAKVCS